MMKATLSRSAKNYNKLVPAVEQAIKIIFFLSMMPEHQSNLTEISINVDISKSKASAILNTLQRFGFVMRNSETKMYSPGPSLMTIGQSVIKKFNYGELAAPLLKELAGTTESTAILGIITGEDQYTIIRQESSWQISMLTQSNKIHPLTYGAHGKAIVAFMEESRQKKILANNSLYFFKDPSLMDKKRLERELAQCRALGFAQDHETGHPMVKILSSPFFDASGQPMGAIEIIGLMEDADVPEKGKAVVEMAKKFSRMITGVKKEA